MNKEIRVSLPTDIEGFIGRECPHPQCQQYFKVKAGTGLPTNECICPYCGYKGDHREFFTRDQIEYAKSVALKEFLGPELRKLERSFKQLERSTRGGFIEIKVTMRRRPFRLKFYQERELETHVVCDSCGLEFAIYGVFANCPDCGQLNALEVFAKSIEVARKRLRLLDSLEQSDEDLRDAILSDALSGAISVFDALGKALRRRHPDLLPARPRNLFQNLGALSEALSKGIGQSLADVVGEEDTAFLMKMFQVRHIYEHNVGVVDDDFVGKVPNSAHLKGRRYQLERDEVEKSLDSLLEAGKRLETVLEET